MPAKSANPIDVYVGVRMRRIEVDMSQQTLGGHIDLTFQQVQKYEKGMNRIGASRLQQIGKILEVPAAYFFEGAPGGWEPAGAGGDRTANTFLEFLGTRDGQSLVGSFSSMPVWKQMKANTTKGQALIIFRWIRGAAAANVILH